MLQVGSLELLEVFVAEEALVLGVVDHRVLTEEVFVEVGRLVDNVMTARCHRREEDFSLFHLARLLQPDVQVIVEVRKGGQVFETRHELVEGKLCG